MKKWIDWMVPLSISYWWKIVECIQSLSSTRSGKPTLSTKMRTFVFLVSSFQAHNRSPPGPMFLFVYCDIWRCLLCCKVRVARGSYYLFTAHPRFRITKLTKPLSRRNVLHNGWHWVFQTTPNSLSPDCPKSFSYTVRLTGPPAPRGVRATTERQLAYIKAVCGRMSLELEAVLGWGHARRNSILLGNTSKAEISRSWSTILNAVSQSCTTIRELDEGHSSTKSSDEPWTFHFVGDRSNSRNRPGCRALSPILQWYRKGWTQRFLGEQPNTIVLAAHSL